MVEGEVLQSGGCAPNLEGTTMSPVKLVIFGEYWDSYLYRGRLHLFGLDSSLLTLDWNQLAEGLGVPEDLILAAECAFRRSDYFYSDRDQWSLLFRDPEIKALILGKFNRLAELKLVVEPASLKRFAIGQQDSPFPFPHTDLTIYNKKAYACSSLGVFEANCDGKTKAPVSSRRRTLWDAGALCVALSYGTAAIAAGAEGLYRLPIDYRYSENGMEPVRLSNHACNSCFWSNIQREFSLLLAQPLFDAFEFHPRPTSSWRWSFERR